MAALPSQNRLLGPVEWSIQVAKNFMQTGSYVLSGTVGFHPYREMTTLTWRLPKAEALSLLNTLKADSFNGVYEYTDLVKGLIRVRPIDTAGYDERRGNQYVMVSLAVECVSA